MHVKKKVFDFGKVVYENVHIVQVFSYLYNHIGLTMNILSNKAFFLNIYHVKCI